MSTKSRQFKKRTGYTPHQHESAPRRPKGTGEIKNGKCQRVRRNENPVSVETIEW